MRRTGSARPNPATTGAGLPTVVDMSEPFSVRIDADVVDRLRRLAALHPGTTESGLAQRLVDEGLRQAEHPGIVFRDGPAGRRAALACGPDVWEVVRALRELDDRGDAAVSAAAELLHLSPAHIRTAIRYYVAFTREIDAEVTEADTASAEAEAAWRAEQRTPG